MTDAERELYAKEMLDSLHERNIALQLKCSQQSLKVSLLLGFSDEILNSAQALTRKPQPID